MDFSAFYSVISSPFIQFFILALLAGFCRSDLTIPEDVTKALSMYLMLAIGLKGGLGMQHSDVAFSEIFEIFIAGVLLSFTLPLVGFMLLRATTEVNRMDAAAISAHYGSVSVVTFSYAASMLSSSGITYGGHIVSLMALMEAPAILTGLMLAKTSRRLDDKVKSSLLSAKVIRDVFLNGSVVLLIGGMVIGLTADADKLGQIKPYLIDPFNAVLCLFLIDLGLLTARKLQEMDRGILSIRLILFGIYMPLISAGFGLLSSWILNLELGEAMLLTTLCASASYIAVPAAMRIALPQANAALYVALSLSITFPFNLLIGIPIYLELARFIIAF